MNEWRKLGGDLAAKPGCDKPECYGQICVEPERCYGEELGRGEGAQLTTERRPMGIWLSEDDCNILMHGLRDQGELEGHLIPEALERYEELCNRIIDMGTGYGGGASDA